MADPWAARQEFWVFRPIAVMSDVLPIVWKIIFQVSKICFRDQAICPLTLHDFTGPTIKGKLINSNQNLHNRCTLFKTMNLHIRNNKNCSNIRIIVCLITSLVLTEHKRVISLIDLMVIK